MSTTNKQKRRQAKKKARESRGRSKARARVAAKAAAPPSPAARFFGWDPGYHAAQDAETRRGMDRVYREALADRAAAEYPDLYRKLATGLPKDAPRAYVRFGRVRPDERSQIWGPAGATHEKGTSVFAARETADGHYLLDLDNSLQQMLVVYTEEKRCYVVRGRVVGRGINGEPLLRDVHYMEPLPGDSLLVTKTPSFALEEWNGRRFGGPLEDAPGLSGCFEEGGR